MSKPEPGREGATPGCEDATEKEEFAPDAVKLIPPAPNASTDLQDPAILMMGPTKYVYTRDMLFKLRLSPFSAKRPEYLDMAHDNNGIWDPERWHLERKTSEASSDGGSRNGNGSAGTDPENHRRRSGDPKDRLRREHDGIVLSPQRRSFNSGCFVPVRDLARSNRSHSPLGGKTGDASSHIGHREIPQGPPARRIGSGRILSWDYQEKNDADNDFGYRRERRDTDRDERFERRSFGRDDPATGAGRQAKGAKEGGGGPFGRSGNRYDRRRPSENKEEEPEWFSEGPLSQHDTIELRGFDDNDKVGKKKMGAQKKKAGKDKDRQANGKGDESQKPEDADEGNKVVTEAAKEAARADDGTGVAKEKEASAGSGDAPKCQNRDEKEFNLDDFLQDDVTTSILRNGIENQSSGSSKFSKWFKRYSPVKSNDKSRRSSMEDEHHLIKTILNDITESTVNIPGDSESYFAPISPAANTGSANVPPGVPPQAFIEMLHRGKHQQRLEIDNKQGNLKNIDIPGKVLILEELEAKMRKGDVGVTADLRAAHQNVTSDSDENAAFKKLLAQVNAGNLVPASNGPVKVAPPAMSLMEMLSHSQKQDEAARMVQMNTVSGHVPNDHPYKLQQQQSQLQTQQAQRQQLDTLNKLINTQIRQPTRTTPPLNDISIHAASRELLNRPEAQAIFQGLKRGDITPQNLYQQLANPAMQSRHRELLQTILKVLAATAGPSPRVLSPMTPQHAAFQQQQQQQLRVSPLPPNAYCVSPILAASPNTLTVPALQQRIPSPRELQLHTQHIMHNALIKKKLEEQTENFRKKQESQQRAQQVGGAGGLSPAKNVASPTQLAWGTPTSVLRKMTAEKEEGKDSNKNDQNKVQQGRPVTGMRTQSTSQQQWTAATQFQQQVNKQGRAIVKNNANFQQQVQQQQHDQLLLQQRIFNQQQQRKQSQQQQFANMQFTGLPQQFGQAQQFSQHQLRAQHQARVQHQHQSQPQQQPSAQQQHYGQHHQWLLQSQSFDNRQVAGGRSGANDGEISPTSNQLARWFSSELLERARKGKLPNMPPPNLSQHAMSLEEIERQATPAVHN